MSTSVSSSLGVLPDIIPSWLLDGLSVSTDKVAVEVALRRYSQSSEPVYSQVLWAYSGKVGLSLASLVESEIEAARGDAAMAAVEKFYLDIKDHSTGTSLLSESLSVIYSRRRVSPDGLKGRFLNYNGSWRIPSGIFPQLAVLMPANSSQVVRYTVSAMTEDDPDSTFVVTFEETIQNTSPGYDVKTTAASWGTLRLKAAAAMSQASLAGKAVICSVRVAAGQRSVNFIFDPAIDPEDPRRFCIVADNDHLCSVQFWAFDRLAVSSELEQSTAVASGRRIRYAAEVSDSWTIRSMPLSEKEFGDFRAVAAATRAAIGSGIAENKVWPVLISDIVISSFKGEFDPASEEPPEVSIGFRTSDIHGQDLLASAYSRIFTRQFSEQYQ